METKSSMQVIILCMKKALTGYNYGYAENNECTRRAACTAREFENYLI